MNAGSATTPKLGVQAATKVYHTASGDLLALDRCSVDVHANEIVSIVGPSGCGKTTLLWSMSGLHRLTSGGVRLDGKEITGPHPDIGIVFQEANLLPWRNLDANIHFPFEIKGEKPDRAWIAHLINRVGLDGFGGKFPRELSGGMQQRAAIVRALALKPSVLLMDEPFGALDSFTREEMNRLVEEIWLDTKTTIVFITHSIEEAIFLSDRVVVLSARPGRVAKEYRVPFARPRSLEIMATKEVFDLTNKIKMDIVGERTRPKAPDRPTAEIVRIRP
ncbi:ABC transporter ATP-binding protein [Mesorhizobium sp. YC-39]|uniref:ABC transporter ATP-binding protein n=1 Tax=unclassified Mesorhizobium TaxID=325217 RepID=UPI0021E920FF|nr:MULTISPECIES: ABC transporter ATP-binding protein [unclassified Mesorhizobium]MCV3206828.1 ABC transporter ATP-binding protein [Mesorhizobium sp. YC-2]MCV3226772.1 ABC transporter ATP-binding protein [Mesorhizobium sp. YC-39]